MKLIDHITQDIAAAMRAREAARLSALRMAKAALMNAGVARGRDLEDAEERQVLTGLIKQRRDASEQFRAAGRGELADKEQAEIGVLEAYLPPPADPAQLEGLVDAAIAETGASGAKDVGRVMKVVMIKASGLNADGRTINELVRRKLGA